MKVPPRSEIEDTLKRKEIELAKAKDRYSRLNHECNAMRSTLDILAHDERNGNCSDPLKNPSKGQHCHSGEGRNPEE